MRILVVEDDLVIARHVEAQLGRSGYGTEVVHDGEEALRCGETNDYAAVILDLGLPRLDGLSVLQLWRSRGRTMPVIVVTARANWAERVLGINAGADDYLPKPFAVPELLARLGAVLRRTSGYPSKIIHSGEFAADLTRREFFRNGAAVPLTPLEFRLIAELAINCGHPVKANQLLERIYGSCDSKEINSLERLVARLRKKAGHSSIETVRGQGYILGTGQ